MLLILLVILVLWLLGLGPQIVAAWAAHPVLCIIALALIAYKSSPCNAHSHEPSE